MTHNGLGVGVRVMRVAVYDAGFPQVAKAALAEAIVVTHWQITAKLVHGYLQDQFRLVRIVSRCRNKKGRYE